MNTNATLVTLKDSAYELIVREIPTLQKAYIVIKKAESFSAVEEILLMAVPELRILGAKEVFVCAREDAGVSLPSEHFEIDGMQFQFDHNLKTMLVDLLNYGAMAQMKKAAPQKTPNIILLPLTAILAKDYLEIYNEAFATVPNGAIYTIEDIVRMMHNPDYEGGVIQVNGENAGVYELNYTEDVPEVASVALTPAYRGKGYGKKAFRSALYKLEQKGFKNAFVLVSTKNIEASSLYTELGFVDDKLISTWYKYSV